MGSDEAVKDDRHQVSCQLYSHCSGDSVSVVARRTDTTVTAYSVEQWW